MAKQKADPEKPPRKPADKITAGLLTAAALSAIAGFGVLFSIWWRSGITTNQEILRIASQQYINGNPIIAGDLAETVQFASDDEHDLPEFEASASPAAESNATEGNQPGRPDDKPETAAEQAARQAKQQQREWRRLRDFLVGAGKVARAEIEADQRDRRKLLIDALPYLEASAEAGFPPGRQTEGLRILGESMFELGNYDRAAAMMQQAIDRDPTLRRRLLWRLAEAQLYAPGISAEASLATMDQYLRDRSLQSEDRWSAAQIRIRSLIKLKRWDDAAEALDTTRRWVAGSRDDDSKMLESRRAQSEQLQLLQAVWQIQKTMDRLAMVPESDRQPINRAVPELASTLATLEDLQREAIPPVPAQARLWSARANLIVGRKDDALALLTIARQQRPLGPVAIVAGLEEIELLARQRRGQEVLQTTRYLMRELRDRQGYQAGELSFGEFQRRMTDALDQLRRQGDFEHAIDAARTLAPVFQPSEALIQEGIGYQQWANATRIDNLNLSNKAARGAAKLARLRYRAAGDAFAKAAELLFDTQDYLPTQWSAIEAYQEGRHFSRSIALLEPYLRYEERRRQPRGLVAYGRALLAEGSADEAIKALTTCIEVYPRDPLRYDARLLAALAHSENGDLPEARQLLTANLQDGDLTPQSPAFRDSLFTLAELLYQRGYRNHLDAERVEPKQRLSLMRDNQPMLEEAVRYLDRAVERYKWIPRAESAAYLSARARILASRWPRLESESPEILDAARRSLRARADSQLQVALDGFIQLRDHLLSREDERGLPDREQRLLRNCYIGEADVLKEMERFPEATGAYQSIELRYLNEPIALEAILGRADCLRSMGRQTEASLLIRQANVVLGRIPKEWDGRFAEVTRYDRKGWEDLLGWMNNRINDGA